MTELRNESGRINLKTSFLGIPVRQRSVDSGSVKKISSRVISKPKEFGKVTSVIDGTAARNTVYDIEKNRYLTPPFTVNVMVTGKDELVVTDTIPITPDNELVTTGGIILRKNDINDANVSGKMWGIRRTFTWNPI